MPGEEKEKLTLGELEALTSFCSAILLTFFLTAVASKEAFLFQRMLASFVFENEAARDAQTDCFSLRFDTTTTNADDDIV